VATHAKERLHSLLKSYTGCAVPFENKYYYYFLDWSGMLIAFEEYYFLGSLIA
jgi:hypothetical protein